MRTVFPNAPRNSRKPQLLSFFTNESRAKSKGGDAGDETTDGRSVPDCGSDTAKVHLEVLEKGGLEQSRACRSSYCRNPADGSLPHEGMANKHPCIHGVRFAPPNHSLPL